jgi:ketosteroid isomerase-like protein
MCRRTESDLVRAVRASIEGWNNDDFDACIAFAHPQVEWISAVAEQLHPGAVYRGLDGARRYWDEWHDLWRIRLNVLEIAEAGDTVVVVACTEARGDASGVVLRQRIGYVYEFEDGLARRVQSYIDPAEAFEAAGIEPQSARVEPRRASEPELYSATSQGR